MAISSGSKSSEAVDQSIIKDQLNYLNSMHEAPAVRLDAEFYQADDIDGTGEGLTGSGNLNYLVLQSQQTNDTSTLNNPFNIMNGDNILGGGLAGGGTSVGDVGSRDFGGLFDDDSGMALAGDSGDVFVGGAGGIGSEIPGLGSGMGIAGVTALKARSLNDVSNESNTKITRIENPPKPEGPEKPPEDPKDPVDPPDVDDYDLVVDVDTPVLDVDLDVILDPIEDILGDIDIDIDAIIDNILPGAHGILPDISASVDAVLDGTTLIGIDLSEILEPLDPVVSGVTNLLDDIIGDVESLLPNELLQPVTNIINTVVDLTGLNGSDGDTDLLINLGAVIPGFTVLDTALDIPLNPVELLLGDIDMTVDGQTLVEDLGTHTFAIIDDLHDTDLGGILNTVAGEDGVLQNIDGIVPEVLLGLDVATDILPDFAGDIATDTLLSDLGNLAGDIVDGLLGHGTPEPGGDTDLTVDTGLEVLGLEIPDINLDVPLDPVEALLGDIDIDVDVESITDLESVSDILNDIATGDIEGVVDDLGTSFGLNTHLDLLGNNDVMLDSLPDNLGGIAAGNVDDLTGGLGDAVGNLLGSPQIPDVLPDPVGTITEGLGHVVDTTPVLGGLGGLLHGGGGGLFG